MGEGFVVYGFVPLTEGTFFGSIEEEFEPTLGGDAVEHAGVAEVAAAAAAAVAACAGGGNTVIHDICCQR